MIKATIREKFANALNMEEQQRLPGE